MKKLGKLFLAGSMAITSLDCSASVGETIKESLGAAAARAPFYAGVGALAGLASAYKFAKTPEQKSFYAGLWSGLIPGGTIPADIYALSAKLDQEKIDCLEEFWVANATSGALSLAFQTYAFGHKYMCAGVTHHTGPVTAIVGMYVVINLAVMYKVRAAKNALANKA